MSEELNLQQDRMRFTKNTTSSRLALLAIVFNVLFFISIYKVNEPAYYTYMMGISILCNLVFMLLAFLASEGVKNYNARFSILLFILAGLQIVRIFIYPATMHVTAVTDTVALGEAFEYKETVAGFTTTYMRENRVMPDAQYVRMIIYLALSAASLVASAVINLRKSRSLAAYNASLRQA